MLCKQKRFASAARHEVRQTYHFDLFQDTDELWLGFKFDLDAPKAHEKLVKLQHLMDMVRIANFRMDMVRIANFRLEFAKRLTCVLSHPSLATRCKSCHGFPARRIVLSVLLTCDSSVLDTRKLARASESLGQLLIRLPGSGDRNLQHTTSQKHGHILAS